MPVCGECVVRLEMCGCGAEAMEVSDWLVCDWGLDVSDRLVWSLP